MISGEPVIVLPENTPPMPYDLPVAASDRVLGTEHVIVAADHAGMDDGERRKWRLHRSGGLDYPARPVPLDPMFLGLWLGDGDRRNTRVYNSHEEEVVQYLRRNAARLDMQLSFQGHVAYATIMGPGGAVPELRPPDGRDMPFPPKRQTYLSIYRRRIASGWSRTESKNEEGRWIWLLPDGTEWSGTVRHEWEDGMVEYGSVNEVDCEQLQAEEDDFYERMVLDIEIRDFQRPDIDVNSTPATRATPPQVAMPGRHMNKLIRILRDLGVIPVRIEAGPENDAKHIPDIYLFNSREVWLRLAAGIIDADGSYNPVTNSFLIIQSRDWHESLLNDVALLFRSLGFVTNR